MSLYDRQRSSVVTLKGQGASDHISRTPGQEVAQIEAELRTLGVRKGHKCPFCRLPVPDKLRWKTQGGGKDCPLMYRGNCPNAKPRVNALGRRMRTLREAAEAEAVADDLVSSCVEIKILRRVLNHRVGLHAIDATPARWRGDAGSSPLDRARTAASSPRDDLVKIVGCTRRTG